jgi:multidrug efflux pump subunit AcrA (membrane-fusion protein)
MRTPASQRIEEPMQTFRGVVLPVLRLVVWTVIAVALVVLAFRGGGGEAGRDAAQPAPVQLESPQVPVTRGSVQNTVTVTGTVVADAAVPVKVTAAGTVRKVLVAPGAVVTAGQGLLQVTVTTERDPVTTKDADGEPVVTAREPLVSTVTVNAPAAGTLTTLDVLADQVVAVGDAVGSISPGTLSVTAALTQADQFRLLSPPATADVTVQGGPAPFTCTGLTLGDAPAADGTDPGGDPVAAPVGGSGPSARCAVPAGTPVFAGMAAGVAVQAGTADDVLTLPITAVQGSVRAGNVWVVGEDGLPVETPVTLGLTDGRLVEVTEGVTEGQTVLEFVPVADDTPVPGDEEGMVFGG